MMAVVGGPAMINVSQYTWHGFYRLSSGMEDRTAYQEEDLSLVVPQRRMHRTRRRTARRLRWVEQSLGPF